MNQIDKEHVRALIDRGEVEISDAALSEAFARYVNALPWLGTRLAWARLQPNSSIDVTDGDATALERWIRRTRFGLHEHVIVAYARQPGLICTVPFLARNLDLLFWGAPGPQYLFGFDLETRTPAFCDFVEYDGVDTLTGPRLMPLEEEMLEQLRGERERSEIVVHANDDRYVSLISTRFPFVGSMIAWTKVPGAVERSFPTADPERHLDAADQFLVDVSRAERLDLQQRVVVVGDSAMSVALEMRLGTLARCLRHIACLPQHTYVMAPDGAWVVVFTMEGDLCFGRAPSRA